MLLRFVCLLLFYAIATVFQLYHGNDMMYEMRRRNPKPTLVPTQGIFNPPHHIGTVWEELAFNDVVSYKYTTWKWIAAPRNVISVTRIRTIVPKGNLPCALTNWAISPPPYSQVDASISSSHSLLPSMRCHCHSQILQIIVVFACMNSDEERSDCQFW